jgi:3-oxoacyl-[acyl-carrier-protein] synthase-3
VSLAPGGVGVLGCGHALGSRVQENDELCATTLSGVTPAWILEKTGIERRHHLGPGESASTLQLEAARGALRAAGVGPEAIDLIVVSTFSGEYLFPPCAARLHRDLGVRGGQCYDLQANCAGFVSALTAASDRMRLDPSLRHALVVGSEVLSPFVDPADPDTAIYFSDGAGAVVLGRVAEGKGIRSTAFFTETSNFESVRLRGGGSGFAWADREGPAVDPRAGFMEQQGLATWKQAVTHLPPTVRRACEAAGLAPGEVDQFIFHQANLQLIQYVLKKLKVPVERAYVNVQRIGNTGAGSIPIALSEATAAGQIRPGQRVVIAGVGAGFVFGASVWEWA